MLDILRQHLGDRVTTPANGKPVTAVVAPGNIEEACAVVRLAREHGHQVIPVGARTKLHWTGPARGPAIEMDMRGLCRVVEYSPEDMTITVEAGMSMTALADLLAENGQRVTLDPPGVEAGYILEARKAGRMPTPQEGEAATQQDQKAGRMPAPQGQEAGKMLGPRGGATVGGVLAANDSGPIRFAFGTARDLVIGMSMIEPDGGVIKSGGKVVKNVAGYDLHKLFIGSHGTMGPIATVTFKLRPLPEARGLVVLNPRDAAEAERMIAAALAGETRPTMIELLNGRMAAQVSLAGRLALIIGFEENPEAVAWQKAAIVKSLGGVPLSAPDSARIYQNLCAATGGAAETSFKATLLSSEVAAFVERADQWPLRLIARAGNGVVYGLLEEPLPDAAWRELESAAVAAEGHLQIRGALPGTLLKRFGRARGDSRLSTAIQRAFDPEAMFAPERLG